MQRQQRLRHRRDFAVVYRSGQSYARGPLAIRVRSNSEIERPRFGFAVGKRFGGVVVGNRIKRRLRESARLSGASGGADIVVIARKGAERASYQELNRVLLSLLARSSLLDGSER